MVGTTAIAAAPARKPVIPAKMQYFDWLSWRRWPAPSNYLCKYNTAAGTGKRLRGLRRLVSRINKESGIVRAKVCLTGPSRVVLDLRERTFSVRLYPPQLIAPGVKYDLLAGVGPNGAPLDGVELDRSPCICRRHFAELDARRRTLGPAAAPAKQENHREKRCSYGPYGDSLWQDGHFLQRHQAANANRILFLSNFCRGTLR